MSINLGDAEVALRSFGRRYSEIINGPAGDDAWERRVRHCGPQGESALGAVMRAEAALTSLAGAISVLTSEPLPTIQETATSEPSQDTTIATVAAGIKVAAAKAADSLKSHSPREFDRRIQMGGTELSAIEAVGRTVDFCVSGLKAAQQAIDAAP